MSDYLADSPGKALASFVADNGDAIDIARNLEIAEVFGVDGVVTVGTDQAIPAVAAVADRFGLPCHVTPEGAQRATNKAAMKTAFAEWSVPTARTWILRSPDDLTRAVNEAMDSGKPTLVNAVIDEKAGTESGRIGNLNPQSVVGKK